MAQLTEITDQTFEEEVLKSDRPAIIDFLVVWFSPCRSISPIIGALAERYEGQVKVGKRNIDENPNTPAKYGVRAIPTILAFKDGQVVQQIQGARSKADFEAMVKDLL